MKKINEKYSDIKILVACHNPSYVPDIPLLYPIQVGSAVAQKQLEGMLQDNTGDNISAKNKSYCELTALYWAWKNLNAEYYGLFHYRRYLSFREDFKTDEWGNINVNSLTQSELKKYNLTAEKMNRLIASYDVITVQGRKYSLFNSSPTHRTVYDEYDVSPAQHKKDLDIVIDILCEKYPEYMPYALHYLHSDCAYECNMFIMKKELFNDYCSFLFNILAEAEKKINTEHYNSEENRVFGFLGERLFGIYLTRLKEEKMNKILELPKLYIKDTSSADECIITPVFEDAVPVVMAANDKFAPHLDVMLHSLIKNSDSKRNYDIIILHNDISENNQCKILFSAEGNNNISIRFFNAGRYFNSDEYFINQHLSVETYYRLMIPSLMPDYKKVLYLDCDMIIERDVAELYDIDIKNNLIGACSDIDVAGQVKLNMDEWGKYATEKLGLKSPFDYVQAGVLVLNLNEIRKTTSSEKMMKLAVSDNWRCHDQDVLNIICKNRIFVIPQKWNVLMNWENEYASRMKILEKAPFDLFSEYKKARENPYIVHFAGYQKPWNEPGCDFSEYYWKYAVESVYYPLILQKLCSIPVNEKISENSSDEDVWILPNKFENLKKFTAPVLPYGSKRRESVKNALRKICQLK